MCNGVLYSARYRRKPRGRLCQLGEERDWRFSFCCTVDGCRKRATPPSLRFLGRKVYLAAMVVLIAIMRQGATAAWMRQLSGLAGVGRRTVGRWRVPVEAGAAHRFILLQLLSYSDCGHSREAGRRFGNIDRRAFTPWAGASCRSPIMGLFAVPGACAWGEGVSSRVGMKW